MIQRIIKSALEGLEEAAFYPRLDPSMLDEIPEQYRGTNRDYQKFIVISHHRSASSVIINTLRKHPNVFRFSEIFLGQYIQFKKPGYDDHSRKIFFLRKHFPIEFLERQIFAPYRDEIRAVGFKMFPEQLDNQHFSPVWDWLEQNTNIKIIYLIREDLLAYHTSFALAMKTGTWGIHVNNASKKKKDSKVYLDYNKCLKSFQRRKAYNEYALKRCQNHDVLKVSYENVTSDLNDSILKIQGFIGLEPRELEVTTVRQQVRSLPEVISNYQELKDRFATTEWSYLFA